MGKPNRSEPKRVIYVGVTRAEKLLAIAVPAPFVDRVAAIMQAGQVSFKVTTSRLSLQRRPIRASAGRRSFHCLGRGASAPDPSSLYWLLQ